MSYSEYKTVVMPIRPENGWAGHLRKTGWKYGIRGTCVEAPHANFFIDPNTPFLILEELPQERFLVRLYGDDQNTECIIDNVDFSMETYPI